MRMRAQMLRCALRAVVTLVAQKGGNVLRAPCSLLRVRDGRVQSCASWSNFSGLWQAGGKGFGSVTLRFLRVSEAQHEIPELKIVRLVPFLVKFIEVQLHGTRMFKGRSIDIPPSHLDRLEPLA